MKEWNFPTGEYGVIVNDQLTINWNWTKEKDVFKICTQINALSEKYPHEAITLNAPYLPYSRQDKMFNIGESVSFGLLINLLANSCIVKDQLIINTLSIHNLTAYNFYCKYFDIRIARNFLYDLEDIIKDNSANIVFPDVHAYDHFNHGDNNNFYNNRYYCKKIRGEMGKIISYECDTIKDVTLPTYIMDDICDGGATFIKCAEALKAQGVKDIRLFVYHGFFTKGLDALFEAGIKEIYTTNSVCRIEHPNLHIIGEDCYV
jgi:ribose-phosphate pyrophosphokinase